MNEIAAGMWFAGGLFVGTLLLLELGRRLRQRQRARHGESIGEGLGAIGGAVFGLMGLLLAFTFSGAASRFDHRRELVVEEANAIGSAYLRLDLLPPEPRRVLQQRMRDYVDARLALYRAIPDSSRVRAALEQGATVQQEIWNGAVTAVREAPVPQLAAQVLPVLSDMFDLAATRLAVSRIHPPPIIYGLLGVVSLLCALLAGYGMGPSEGRSWLHILALAAILSITVYVIVDLEYPRLGLFQVTEFDQLLVDVRAGMAAEPAAPDSASFINRVWVVAESKQVAEGELRVFLPEGTLVMAAPHATPAFGSWRYRGDSLTITEEDRDYPVDIVELTEDAFRIRIRGPGEPVVIRFRPAESP